MITLNNVSKQFRGSSNGKRVTALDAVSLHISEGEFVSVLGPSGCGKTTLLNIVAGFITASEGDVSFQGNVVEHPSHERIVVFQDHNLFPWKTVVENISFGLRAQGYSPQEQRTVAEQFVNLVYLNGFEDSYPCQLSGGMRQRVALARALAVDPNCILMDEPLGSLDAQIREKLQLEVMAIWQKTKKTILMVTHDIDEAIFLSERVLVMSKAPGTINEVISINFPYPRDPSIKMSHDFQNLKYRLWRSITQ